MFNGRVKRVTLGLLCLFFLIVLMYLLSVPAHAQAQSQRGLAEKTILILHGPEANAPFSEATDRRLETMLRSGGISYTNQFLESLD